MTRYLISIGAALALSAADVNAQPGALVSAQGHTVFVIDEDRREWQGRLIRVSAEALEVESDAGIRTFKLATIRRVDADGDGVWDGFLKGLAAGATMGLIAVANQAEPWVILTNGVTTGVLGLAIDGACSSRHPVYHGPAAPRTSRPMDTGSPAIALRMQLRW